jgi:hypothetical protein
MKRSASYRVLLISVCCVLVQTIYAQAWQWAKTATLAHSTNTCMSNAVATDQAGNVYVAGSYFSQSIQFNTYTLTNAGANGADIFVVKYSSSGSIYWAKTFGGSGNDEGYGIALDHWGNIYVTGGFDSPTLTLGPATFSNMGGEDSYLMKLDNSGNVIWARAVAGSGNDIGNAVCTDPHGNVCITGDFNSPVLAIGSTNLIDTTTQTQPFMARLDSSGTLLWAKTATGSGGTNGNYGAAICSDTASNVFVTGGFSYSTIYFGSFDLTCYGITNVFITKYDSSGNVLWLQGAGGANEDAGSGIGTDKYGNVYIGGSFNSHTITFGATTVNNAGNEDVFITKYSAGGTAIWATGAGGNGIDQATSLSVDPNGYSWLCGSFGSPNIQFGPNNLVNNGFLNIFLTEYDPGGAVLWASGAGGSASDFALGVANDGQGTGFLTGYFNSSSVGFGSNVVGSSGQSNMYIAKITGITGIQSESSLLTSVSVYPNPANGAFFFHLTNTTGNASECILTDQLGREVKHRDNIQGSDFKIDLDGHAPGVYFYVVLNEEHKPLGRGKLVLE